MHAWCRAGPWSSRWDPRRVAPLERRGRCARRRRSELADVMSVGRLVHEFAASGKGSSRPGAAPAMPPSGPWLPPRGDVDVNAAPSSARCPSGYAVDDYPTALPGRAPPSGRHHIGAHAPALRRWRRRGASERRWVTGLTPGHTTKQMVGGCKRSSGTTVEPHCAHQFRAPNPMVRSIPSTVLVRPRGFPCRQSSRLQNIRRIPLNSESPVPKTTT